MMCSTRLPEMRKQLRQLEKNVESLTNQLAKDGALSSTFNQKRLSMEPVGIVAGWGNYPVTVAQSLRASNRPVIIAAINDHADPSLAQFATEIKWFGVAKMGAHQKLFEKHGVKQVVLAGKLFKDKLLFHGMGWMGLMPDLTCLRAFFSIVVTHQYDQRDDSLLGAVVRSYQQRGLEIVSGTDFAPQLLAEEGVLTRRQPTNSQRKDIHFGWTIAKQMGQLDIGQSVTVRDQAILAVEALEGTDACIERTGVLCPRGGFSLVKVAKPQQDRRFDLPTIGTQTIDRLRKAGGRCIAVEAGQTIIVDREQVIQAADKAGIAIVSIASDKMSTSSSHPTSHISAPHPMPSTPTQFESN